MKTNLTSLIVPVGKSVCAVLLWGIFTAGIARAQDYLGATAVLHQIEERNAKPGQKVEQDESSKLRDDLKAFSQNSTNLAPAVAATNWLALVDRAAKVQQQSRQSFDPSAIPIQPDDLLGALPPPATWGELAKAITARPPVKGEGEIRETGLRLLATTLMGDTAGRSRQIADFQARAKQADFQNQYYYNDTLNQLEQAVMATSDDPDAILKSLAYQLAGSASMGSYQLQVPNLVPQIGPEKTEAFLRKALVAPGVSLQFDAPNETSRLAKKLALELIDQLKMAQWGLVNSLDAVDLYEAMDKRFGVQTSTIAALTGNTNDVSAAAPVNPMDDFQKQGAEIYYLLGLISKNRTTNAVAVAKQIKGQNLDYVFDEAFNEMDNAGFSEAVDDFLHQLLAEDPTLPFWNQYVTTAADAGQTGRMLVLVRAAASRTDLSDKQQAALHQILFKALLAADDVDGGVQEALHLAALDTGTPDENAFNAGQLGVLVARIGILVQRPEFTEEGIGVAKKWLATPAGQNVNNDNSVVLSLAQILFETKRGPEAESVLADALANATRTQNAQPYYGPNRGGAGQILSSLATIYYKAGRYDDVLDLLQQSPDWGAKDLSELFDSSDSDDDVTVMSLHSGGASPLPVPFLAASSLAAKGQNEQAQKIDDALLDKEPGLDRGYELLLALNGTNAIPHLDELFSRNQFQCRPLIWKAHLLRQQNRLAEAEKTIRQAITIDPSDGEEGRGDRMRAYSELADVLEAGGNTNDADFYREVVKAIRMSEDADQFYLAGLLKHAIPMYEQALTHFSDAYCIQSRLAIQLAALGQNAEAEEHYRRAYELMPDSFGRVESHCFGCERAFDGERAQSIAEKVFTQLVAERPNKPQVHYLLGYLRSEQGRYQDALTNYLAAVQLDPDYLNAWVKSQEAGEQTLVPAKERDDITFNILRLDPLQRHAHASFERVSDLAGLWQAAAVAASHQPPVATGLFPLIASQAAVEKKAADSTGANQAMRFGMMEQIRQNRETLSPALAVGQATFVRVAATMIMSGNYDSGN